MSSSRKISVSTATIVGINAMIGAGLFAAPRSIALNVGPAGILAYIGVVIAVWFMALSLARLAALFPEEGSFYTYTRQWAGHKGGILASGSYMTGLIIAMGLLSQVCGSYLHTIFPFLSATVLGIITLATLTILNMFGAALSEIGQQILVLLTIFPIIATTLLCFWHGSSANLFPFAPYGTISILKASRVIIFGFFGFESAMSLYPLVINPQRNVPRALTYSIIVVGILYTAFIGSLIYAVPLSLFKQGAELPEILHAVFSHYPLLISAIKLSIISAILGTIHSMIWGASALSSVFLKKLSTKTINSSFITAGIGAAIFSTFMLIHNEMLFFSFTALFIIFACMLSMISLLTIKAEWKSGRNIITLCGLATALFIFCVAAEELVGELVKMIW